jgi:hypothetical protein
VSDESAHAARALTAGGALTARAGGAEAGRTLLERGIDAWSALDDQEELASALETLGWLLVYDAGDEAASLQAFERSLELRLQLGSAGGERRALLGVCQVLVALGEVTRAEALSLEVIEGAADDPRSEHLARHFLADCALIRGDAGDAEKRYRQSLQAALPLGDVIETSFEVQGIAMAAAGNGDPARALRRAGAVAALRESLGTSLSIAFWDALLERYIGAAKADLAEEADAVWAEGFSLAFDDAVDLALRRE